MRDKVLVRLGHGYYSGGITPLPNVCPTIDAHVDCWHILIGEKMEDIKSRVVGNLKAKRYNEMTSRVYSPNGLAPTIKTMSGGGAEPKIIMGGGIEIINEPLALDEQNGYVRQDGTVGTLTTDGSSPKHNNRIVEVRIGAFRGRNPDNPSDRTPGAPTKQRLEINNNGTANTLTTVQKDNVVVEPSVEKFRIRKLTPKECGRLMGVRDEDIDKMSVNQSNSALYHCFGDSIVVDVLMAIFKQMIQVA